MQYSTLMILIVALCCISMGIQAVGRNTVFNIVWSTVYLLTTLAAFGLLIWFGLAVFTYEFNTTGEHMGLSGFNTIERFSK